MLYMVEMDFATPEREAEWHAWYGRHIDMLLSIPGIHGAQRFRAEGRVRAPYLAIYEVDGPQVFDSEPYRAKAGRSSTGEWKPLMFDWDRNVFDGLDRIPAVPAGSALLLVDRRAPTDPPLPQDFTRLQSVGLDRTVLERGVRVLDAAAAHAAAAARPAASRVFAPLTQPLRVQR